ncbi:ABC transporter ATP-binding protein [Streptomyces sp. PTM05]|uniref:ABC transporter ATP-binding protein n=2 Tax=Streptantibioticus parmotrematis TaxID=2873249 RepID=A0ABS7R5D8_9ACTN|nr:ABC transporter ATP-binding protein [Streptantibioticus parmotrematis]
MSTCAANDPGDATGSIQVPGGPGGTTTTSPTSSAPPAGSATAAPGELSVLVDDLHVTYRVPMAGGRRGGAPGAVWRMLHGERGAGTRTVRAVRGVSLMTRRGDVIGVIGRNGSGKSTLLRAIAGLLPPDAGRVYVRERPSLLGVDPGLMGDLSGERNIVLGCLAMGMSARQVRDAFAGIAEFAGLGEALDRPLRTYSTGMAQRLRFAITTAAPHEVLLIDEALATGDAEFRHRSARRLEEMRAEAGTVFLVSHSLAAIEESCGRAVWMEAGRVRMDGGVPEVLAAYRENEAHGG